jgi:hypothetical protein
VTVGGVCFRGVEAGKDDGELQLFMQGTVEQ